MRTIHHLKFKDPSDTLKCHHHMAGVKSTWPIIQYVSYTILNPIFDVLRPNMTRPLPIVAAPIFWYSAPSCFWCRKRGKTWLLLIQRGQNPFLPLPLLPPPGRNASCYKHANAKPFSILSTNPVTTISGGKIPMFVFSLVALITYGRVWYGSSLSASIPFPLTPGDLLLLLRRATLVENHLLTPESCLKVTSKFISSAPNPLWSVATPT